MMSRRFFFLALLVFASAGCGNRASGEATNTTGPSSGPAVSLNSTCPPADQDQYVYRPARLQPILPCVRATGTVVAKSTEADGDIHLQLRLDAPAQGLLNAGNEKQGGNLVVEPICQFPPVQADAIRICASDPNPVRGPVPSVGEHVWMEGRYVLDLQHYGWAELHPLYRWGHINP